MKNTHKNKIVLFDLEQTALALLFVPATFSLIFYLLKGYVFINPNSLIGTILDQGFSTCYFFSSFFAPGALLILIGGLILRMALIKSEQKKQEEI